MADHQAELLLQAAAEAVSEFQAGRLAPSVADILHLEKRWDKLSQGSSGSVAVEDAKALLGQEVLAGEPLDHVVQEVLASQGAPAAAPLLTKRQFLALAHVAEVAQSKAFDLVTAEDAAAPRASPSVGQKKRPPPIRDAHLDAWRIAAAPGGAAPHADDAYGQAGAAEAAEAEAAHSGCEGGASLSHASSLVPRDVEGAALSRQSSAEGLEAVAAALFQQHPHLAQQGQGQHQSGATSYVSALELEEVQEGGPLEGELLEGEEGDELAPLPLDAEVAEFTNKLNGLMERVSSDVARLHAAEGLPLQHASEASEGGTAGGMSSLAAAAAGVEGEEQTRGSWESFNSGSSGRGGQATQQQAAGPPAIPQQEAAAAPPQQQQAQLNEAMISAAMAAGMTFMQHLQAATGGHAPSAAALADLNPLRQAAAAAAAAVAASPAAVGSNSQATASVGPASPEVVCGGTAAGAPQQLIAEMMAHLNLETATPEQLQAAAASLQQQALARQQQQPASSQAGSAGSAPSSDRASAHQQRSDSVRQSWRAFEADGHMYHQQHYQQRELSLSPQKPSRLGMHAAGAAAAQDAENMPPPAPRLRAPTMEGLCGGWTAMSQEDLLRCQAIFNKKGYGEVGGMERHYAMEYFAKLRMEGAIFHAAWGASDLGADGRLDCREFCIFVQLLRGAQKGLPLPSRLTPDEAAALLGEAPMPPQAAAQGMVHIDAAHMRAVLGSVHSGSAAERAESVLHGMDYDDDDDASSMDSGIAESVISTASRRGGLGAHHPYALGGRPTMAAPRSRLGSVLGAAYNPLYARSEQRLALGGGAAGGEGGALDQVAHSLLEVAVRSAEIRYRKPLSTPIFTLSVRDSLGRLVELPIDTHPGHYRRETSMIHSSAIVRLTTQLNKIPPGSVLFLEVKHWKGDKKRFSTLAWAYAPLEKLVDFGPSASRVRSGPLDLPLYKKPVDLTLQRTRRLTSRAFDLHLTLRGIE